MLRHRKLMKHKYKLAAEKFNNKPLKPDWIRFAMDLGLLEPTPADHPPLSVTSLTTAANVSTGADNSLEAVGHIKDTAKDKEKEKESATAAPKPLTRLVEVTTGMDAVAIAGFLRRTPGLGKTQIGEYISKGPPDLYPFHALVLKEYVRTFDFSGRKYLFITF